MQVIRRKDNPLSVLSSGHVPKGGLGEFDDSIYEEVSLDRLPDGYIKEKRKSFAEKLEEFFDAAYKLSTDFLDDKTVSQLFLHKAAVGLCLDKYPDAAVALIKTIELPKELEAYRQELLIKFEEEFSV